MKGKFFSLTNLLTLTVAIFSQSALAQVSIQSTQQILLDQQGVGVAVGDINSDGRKDVVVTSCGCGYQIPSKIYIFLGQSDGTLSTTPITYTMTGGGGSVAIGDVTGDGRPDLVLSSGGNVWVMAQNSSGTLDAPIVYSTTYADGFRLGDLNGDGRLDLIGLQDSVNAVDNADYAGVFYQNPSGTFDPAVLASLPHGVNDDIKLADINGDGRTDVVVVDHFHEPAIVILYQNADGTLSAPVTASVGPGVLVDFVGVGDFNGDGRKDLVVTYDSGQPSYQITVLLQNSDGTFTIYSSYGTTSGVTSLQVADVDNDGRDDVLLLHTASAGVWLQNSYGGFGNEQVIPLPDNGGSISHYQLGFVAEDINGDGLVDLVYAQGGSQGALTIVYGIRSLVNRPPVAKDDYARTRCGESVVIPVLANDSDPDGDPLFIKSVLSPSNGTAVLTPDRKQVLYTPNRRFHGVDKFQYLILDGKTHATFGTVYVTVR